MSRTRKGSKAPQDKPIEWVQILNDKGEPIGAINKDGYEYMKREIDAGLQGVKADIEKELERLRKLK